MKKVIEKILVLWFSLPTLIIRLFYKAKYNNFVFTSFLKHMEGLNDYFYTYNVRPKKALDIISIEKEMVDAKNVAIIMQGPLILEDNFTLETIKIYNLLYPGVSIIVSTWDNENKDYIEKIRKCNNCVVLLNKYPERQGFCNVNYQTVTTVAGLKKAKELNKQYVFKTRNDYRFTKKGLIEFMINLLADYPCLGSEFKQKSRIIFTGGRQDDMFRQFFIGDQFNFGHIDDLLRFWDFGPTEINQTFSDFDKERRNRHYSWKEERNFCRILSQRYSIQVRGKDFDNSIKDYWAFVKDYLIILSAKDVDAYWFKYNYKYEETYSTGEYYIDDDTKRCFAYNWNYCTWLNLYHGQLKYEDWMEQISESNFF